MATEYVVLMQDADDPEVFRFAGTVEVDYGPEQVVRSMSSETAATVEDGDDTYICVPVRNWNVVSRHVEVPPPVVRVTQLAETGMWLAGLPTRTQPTPAVSVETPQGHVITTPADLAASIAADDPEED